MDACTGGEALRTKYIGTGRRGEDAEIQAAMVLPIEPLFPALTP
jgi:hypothetical protein